MDVPSDKAIAKAPPCCNASHGLPRIVGGTGFDNLVDFARSAFERNNICVKVAFPNRNLQLQTWRLSAAQIGAAKLHFRSSIFSRILTLCRVALFARSALGIGKVPVAKLDSHSLPRSICLRPKSASGFEPRSSLGGTPSCLRVKYCLYNP